MEDDARLNGGFPGGEDDQEDKNEPTIDYSKVDPQKLTQEQVEKALAAKGIMRELHQQREENRTLKEQLEAMQKGGESDDLELDEDMPVTGKDLMRVINKFQESRSASEEQARMEAVRANIQRSEQQAYEKYGDGKVQKGLEGKTVITETIEHLKQRNPLQLQAMLRSADPGEELYTYGLALVPKFRSIADKTRHREFVDQLNRGGGFQGGGPGGGGTPGSLALLAMDPEAMLQKSLEGGL